MAVKCVLTLIDSMGRQVTKRIETNQTTLVLAGGAIADYLIDLEAVTNLGPIGRSYSEIGGGWGSTPVSINEVVAYFANFLSGGELRLSDGEYVAQVLSGKMDK